MLTLALCGAMLMVASAVHAAGFTEFVDPNPAPGNQFGHTVVALSTGNVVITSPFDDFAALDAGAVYLFNGATGALISTLRGSSANDNIGNSGVRALANGNFVVMSRDWRNGAITLAGAVTWGSGITGVSGTVSAANSLVGSTQFDQIGTFASVTALANGNYVVSAPFWDNGAVVNAGAATWANGTTGVSGPMSAANSLVGSTAEDRVGVGGVRDLASGNYLVTSPDWDDGATFGVGAVTWGSGTAGVSGPVSVANSLIGSTAGDRVGSGVTKLSNGNYVVQTPNWNNGLFGGVGAVTWGSGTSGVIGTVSVSNSLVGDSEGDIVGGGVTPLANGNYVVRCPHWDDGALANAGAATWGSGTAGVSGLVSSANSLVGASANDLVGMNVIPLANGNYVVLSNEWDSGGLANVGAATWGSGTAGVTGTISAANSLVGSTANDYVGASATALSNGNYVVSSLWDNGAIADAGAATWGSGTTGVSGTISAANSLVGSTAGDNVGSNVVALANGNYVVVSIHWDNGAAFNAGAVTWGSGTSGVSGTISAGNSLVGNHANDNLGSRDVKALTNGNYVVQSPNWDDGTTVDVGAVTWGSGTVGVRGTTSFGSSLIGSTAGDEVGHGDVLELANGNYVVVSQFWDNGGVANAGAVTWARGTTGVSGVVSAANSLVGSRVNDRIGSAGVVALASGDYAVGTSTWDLGSLSDAGAATWGSGVTGVSGAVSAVNSIVGTTANAGLQPLVVDAVNAAIIAAFFTEGGGRVRVRTADPSPAIVSATDVPNDQGGWLRLSFARSFLDAVNVSPPVVSYGVWRRQPGSLATELPAGTWTLLVNVPALQQDQYVAEFQTPTNAPYDYIVTAHTTVPSNSYVSTVASGQSLDNLPPAQPTLFTASYAAGQTNLHWGPNLESDLASYRLYRGTSADFTPSLINRIASPTSIAYTDVGPAGGYYKLSAEDVNGNESSFALVTPQQTTDVGDGEAVVFALHGVRPNPARANALHVAFALPIAAPARLELHDVSGRRVLTREVGSLGPGRHMVNLAEGQRMAAGIYWLSLVQGSEQKRTRVAVIH